MIPIPFNRPVISDSEYLAVMEVMNQDWLSEGPITMEFEAALEDYLGAPTCVVNSGSSALMCALLASGFKPGDQVVVPAITHIATLTAPYILGARIKIVDVDPHTFNMIDKYYESDFITPVDVAGLPCNLFNVSGGKLIHDCAQSFGAKTNSSRYISTYSFQMTKQLTTIEGGCIASTDEGLIDRCRRIKNYGRTKEQYVHDIIGTNWRTTELNSAIGLEQLKYVDDVIKRRRHVFNRYLKELEGPISFQGGSLGDVSSAMFCFVVINNGKMPVIWATLNKLGIDTRRMWLPLNMQPCVIGDPRIDNPTCPNAETIYKNTISLPISNGITDTEVDTIIKEFNRLINV